MAFVNLRSDTSGRSLCEKCSFYTYVNTDGWLYLHLHIIKYDSSRTASLPSSSNRIYPSDIVNFFTAVVCCYSDAFFEAITIRSWKSALCILSVNFMGHQLVSDTVIQT